MEDVSLSEASEVSFSSEPSKPSIYELIKYAYQTDSGVEHLSLKGGLVPTVDLEKLIFGLNILFDEDSLVSLDISDATIPADSVCHIVELMSACHIESLVISKLVSVTDFSDLICALQQMPALTKVDVSCNPRLTADDIRLLFDVPHLEDVNFASCLVHNDKFEAVCKGIQGKLGLKSIDLSDNNIISGMICS